MRIPLSKIAIGLATCTFGMGADTKPASAQIYQIDCAILLCLSGGWPASVPCARARAEFIRRITPWPVEPPLQIWRCPMAARFSSPEHGADWPKLWDIAEHPPSLQMQSRPRDKLDSDLIAAVLNFPLGSGETHPDRLPVELVQSPAQADIDISGQEFNFVRSIRVFNITYASQLESGRDGDCNRNFSLRIGNYGTQGDFQWFSGSGPSQLPEAHVGLERYGEHCPGIFHRSVFVDWRDYQGNYGFEQVNY